MVNLKQFLVKGTPLGYFDWKGNEFKLGDTIEYIDSEGFTCRTEIVLLEDFWVGIETWDRLVGISQMENGDYVVVE